MNYIKKPPILVLLCMFLITGCTGKTPQAGEGAFALLPASGELEGWETSELPMEFIGEDLWNLINGGAEIYHEYGFKRVIAQEYTNSSGNSVSIEAYEMNSPGSAYGVYSFKRGTEGEILDLTNEGLREDYYLNFWKGSFLVTITGFDDSDATIEGLKNFARIVDGRIAGGGERPGLVDLLPEEGLEPLTVKYFLGNLGLFNSYLFETADIFGFSEAAKGDYSDGHSIYIMKYENADRAEQLYENARNILNNSTRYTKIDMKGKTLTLRDKDNKILYLKPVDNYICIVIGAADIEKSEKILSSIRTDS